MNILLNSKHELRSGWKFAAYVVLFLLLWVAGAMAVGLLFTRTGLPQDQLAELVLNEIALLIPAVAAMLLVARFVDRRPLSAFGVGFLPNWKGDLAYGLGLAALMLVVLVIGCYAIGYISIDWTASQAPLGTLIVALGVLIVAAAVEELVFRGLPLQLLVDGMGEWPAMIVMSAIFGALHLSNPNATWLGMANTIVAGFLLSLAYLRTRSLWMPYGIHVGWNVGLGYVLGFPLSGVDLPSLWTTGIAGSDTILGGGYGPEGGLLATFLFTAAAVIINKRR